MPDYPDIPDGFGVPLIDRSTELLPAPTMAVLDARYPTTEEVDAIEAELTVRLSEEALTSTIGAVVGIPAAPTLTWLDAQPAVTSVRVALTPTSPVTYLGGVPVVSDGSIVSTLPGGPLGVSFVVYGQDVAIEVLMRATSNVHLKLTADGRLITDRNGSAPPTPTVDEVNWLHLHFEDAGPHTVTADVRLMYLRAITYPAAGAIAPSPEIAERSNVIVAGPGDSYIGGANEVGAINTWAAGVGELLGTRRALLSGQGGSGFNIAGSGIVFTSPSRLDPIIAANPTDVIIAGGRNDTPYTHGTIYTAARNVLAYLAAGLPDARLHVLLPVAGTDATQASAAWTTVNTAIKDAAAESANVYSVIDPTAEGWFTTANRPTFVHADGIHLNQAGHDYMRNRVAAALAPAILDTATALPFIEVYTADTFTRADGAIGSTEIGALPWTVGGPSTAGSIVSNKLRLNAGGTSWDGGFALVSTGEADGVVEVSDSLSSAFAGILARAGSDGLTGILFSKTSTGYILRKRLAYNSWLTIAGPIAQAPAPNDLMALVLNGTSVKALVNGIELMSVTEADYTANTHHGVYAVAAARSFDNFKFTALPA